LIEGLGAELEDFLRSSLNIDTDESWVSSDLSDDDLSLQLLAEWQLQNLRGKLVSGNE